MTIALNSYKIHIYFFSLGAILFDSESLPMVLHSEINLGRGQRFIGMTRIEFRLEECKAVALTTEYLSSPHSYGNFKILLD